MCWIGPAKIAERDIVVYKLGYVIETTKEFRSLYQNYTYYPKELNKAVTLVPVIYTTEVSKLQPSETGMIYEGYHSYLTKKMAKLSRDEYDDIGIFEIPAGATIYVNYKLREVVSTDIKYLGLLEE
jgi:hypothetical protein